MSNIFPAGKYLTRAKEWAITETTTTKEPQIYIAFADVDGLGQPPAYYGTFGEKALVHTMKALRNCGWNGSDIQELDHAQCGLDSNKVEIVVDHEEYGGKWRAKTKWVNSPGAGVTALAPDKKAAFAQALKAKILQLEQGQPPKSAPRQADGPPPGHPAHADIPTLP